MKKIPAQELFFYILLFGLSLAFFAIISPFLYDIALALILSILFRKYFSSLIKRFKGNKKYASLATVFTIIFVVLIPLTFVVGMVSTEAANSYSLIKNKWPGIQKELTMDNLDSLAQSLPVVGSYIDVKSLDLVEYSGKLGEVVTKSAEYVLLFLQKAFVNLSTFIVHFFFILFLVFYILYDGDKLLNRIYYLSPLCDNDEKEFATELVKITDALVFNIFLVGMIEGVYGAIWFAILGLYSPILMGILMTFLSMIPLVGANTIIVPTALVLLLTGSWGKALLLLVFGTGGILINQNIIKPQIDGNKSGLHPAFVFLSGMGGLVTLGLVGFLIGPLVAALFIVVWNQFGKKYKHELEAWNEGKEV